MAHLIIWLSFTGNQDRFYWYGTAGYAVKTNIAQVATLRRDVELPKGVARRLVESELFRVDWHQPLNIDSVIHLAALAPGRLHTSSDFLAKYRRANTIATINLAQQAADAGVQRFIYLSSIKVNGEYTTDRPFGPEEHGVPTDPYALSKHEAEIGLRQIAAETGMEAVIIRPPLAYGAGVKGNFLQLMNWLQKGIPLPLGAIHNQRSLVALPNLIDLITICIDHPAAANQTFLVSDGEDLSTTDLLHRLGQALNKPARLLPLPQIWLETSLNLFGKQAIAQRLCGNLQIDISHTRETLGWTPPVSVDEALQQTAQAWLTQQNK